MLAGFGGDIKDFITVGMLMMMMILYTAPIYS